MAVPVRLKRSQLRLVDENTVVNVRRTTGRQLPSAASTTLGSGPPPGEQLALLCDELHDQLKGHFRAVTNLCARAAAVAAAVDAGETGPPQFQAVRKPSTPRSGFADKENFLPTRPKRAPSSVRSEGSEGFPAINRLLALRHTRKADQRWNTKTGLAESRLTACFAPETASTDSCLRMRGLWREACPVTLLSIVQDEPVSGRYEWASKEHAEREAQQICSSTRDCPESGGNIPEVTANRVTHIESVSTDDGSDDDLKSITLATEPGSRVLSLHTSVVALDRFSRQRALARTWQTWKGRCTRRATVHAAATAIQARWRGLSERKRVTILLPRLDKLRAWRIRRRKRMLLYAWMSWEQYRDNRGVWRRRVESKRRLWGADAWQHIGTYRIARTHILRTEGAYGLAAQYHRWRLTATSFFKLIINTGDAPADGCESTVVCITGS